MKKVKKYLLKFCSSSSDKLDSAEFYHLFSATLFLQGILVGQKKVKELVENKLMVTPFP